MSEESSGRERTIRMPSMSAEENHSQVRLKIDSHPANLAPVRKAIEALGQRNAFDESARNDIGLCVNEALANVIRHAYGGAENRPIEVTAECDDGCMRISIRDWGNGINPMSLPPRQRDPLTPGGLGLICMCQMMDACEFQPQPDGMLLTLVRQKRRKAVC